MLSLLLSPLKVTVTLIFVTFFTSLSSVTAIEEDFNDIEFIQKYDEVALKVACEAMSASDPELYKLNLTRPFSYQDVTKLAFLNKGLQLSTRMIEFPDDIAWKRKLVNIMFSIWFNYCPDTYINHNYMKIMRELIMIYINSLEVRSTESVEVWEALTKSLQHCQQSEATVYNFTHIAYMVNGIVVDVPNNNITVKPKPQPKPQPPPSPQNGEEDINGTTTGVKGKAGVDEASMLLSGRVDAPGADGSDEGFVTETSGEKIASTESPTDPGDDGGDGGSEPSEPPPPPPPAPPTDPNVAKEYFDLMPQMDAAGNLFQLDIIIENLWHVFSHTWAVCYPEAPSRQLWGPRFKQLFFRDFLEPLEERWKEPGPLLFYLDIIMGDYDVETIQHNIPFCPDAGYLTSGTGLFELVRPVKLAEISDGAGAFQNHQVV